MESLTELEDWDEYRLFTRKHLKLLGRDPELFYVSRKRHAFQIKGKTWKGHLVLVGKKVRSLAKTVRQEGLQLVEGRCWEADKVVTVLDVPEALVLQAQRTLARLKLGFEATTAGAEAPATDPLQAAWAKRKAAVLPTIKSELALRGSNFAELRALLAPMSEREKASDWAGALRILRQIEPLLGAGSSTATEDADADAGENARFEALSDAELAEESLARSDATEPFQNADYLHSLTETTFEYAGSTNLKEIMRRLERGVSGSSRATTIAELAALVDETPARMDADYARFLVLRRQQEVVQRQRSGEIVPALAEDLHGDFMGSQPQLLFGKVVGDVFGIHPVFAALLSPTGGMVGPGNAALHMDDDDPTGYHGIVHDAAGYLYNYHGEGPGYDYLGVEGRPTDDPLTGQQSGMRYWHEKLDPGTSTVVLTGVIDAAYAGRDTYQELDALGTEAAAAFDAYQVELERSLEDARTEVERAIQETLDDAERQYDDAANELERLTSQASEGIDSALEALESSWVGTFGGWMGSSNARTEDKLEAAREYALE